MRSRQEKPCGDPSRCSPSSSSAIVITAALIAQVLAVGTLPTPHQPVLGYEAASVACRSTCRCRKPRVSPAAPADHLRTATRTDRGTGWRQSRKRDVNTIRRVADTGPDSAASNRRGRRRRTRGYRARGDGAAASARAGTGPIRLHSGMKAPVKTIDVAPVYPVIAKSAHVQGRGDSRSGARRAGTASTRSACCDRFRCSIRRRSTRCSSGASRRRC